MLITLWDKMEEYLMEMNPNYAAQAPVWRVTLECRFVLTGKAFCSQGTRLLVFYLANISLTNKIVNRTRVIRTCVIWPHLVQAAAEKKTM